MTLDVLGNFALPIANALFDSVWQGALVAAAAWLGLQMAPGLGASTRYAIWLCALAALAVLPVVTLSNAVPRPAPIASVSDAGQAVVANLHASAASDSRHVNPQPPATAMTDAALAEAAAAPKQHIDISEGLALAIALAWLAAVCYRGVLLLANMVDLGLIRRESTLWSTRRGVPVLLSDRVSVPVAIGFLRGAVVLPAHFAEQLAPEAIEAIVVHEVAHLQRYDVWTNAFARRRSARRAQPRRVVRVAPDRRRTRNRMRRLGRLPARCG